MSMAKTRGEHYTVKDADRFGGYVCLICDTGGDIAWIRSRPCTPSPSTTCPSVSSPPTSESPIPGYGDVQSKLDLDRKMVLMELEQEEAELARMILQQQLDMEQMLLQSMLNEQRSLEVAASAVAMALDKPRPAAPNPSDAPGEPAAQEPQAMEVEVSATVAATAVETPTAATSPPVISIENLPYGILACI